MFDIICIGRFLVLVSFVVLIFYFKCILLVFCGVLILVSAVFRFELFLFDMFFFDAVLFGCLAFCWFGIFAFYATGVLCYFGALISFTGTVC